MSQHSFLFTELNEDALTDGRAFDGVAFGTFRDMLGREITLEADDAADYVANTQAAIEATRTESGELVGLPIDAQGHDKGDGAGWIVGVELVRGVIRFLPKWTEIGRELIGKGIRRFFSATIDVTNKVVLGGTLTNWPATRDESNRVMLRPIELESSIYSIENDISDLGDDAPVDLSGGKNMTDKVEEVQEEPEVTEMARPEPEQSDTPPANILTPDQTAVLLRQFADAGQREPHELLLEVQKRANQIAHDMLQAQMDQRQRDFEVAQLATKYTGSSKYGLPTNARDLSKFLQSLDGEQYDFAIKLFDDIAKVGVVEYQELGHGRRLRQRPLPEVYHASLKAVLDAGHTVAEFCEANGLDQADYDFAPFEGGK